jgi:hypothetical protein
MKTLKHYTLLAACLFTMICSPASAQWTAQNGAAMTGSCFMIHSEQGVLYISTLSSLFTTTDGGVTWNYMDPE